MWRSQVINATASLDVAAVEDPVNRSKQNFVRIASTEIVVRRQVWACCLRCMGILSRPRVGFCCGFISVSAASSQLCGQDIRRRHSAVDGMRVQAQRFSAQGSPTCFRVPLAQHPFRIALPCTVLKTSPATHT